MVKKLVKKKVVVKKKTKPIDNGISLTSMKHPPAKSKHPISKYKISKKNLEKVEIDLDLKAIKKKALAKKKPVKKKASPKVKKIDYSLFGPDDVSNEINKQKDCCMWSWSSRQFLFAKKIEIMVNKVNNNSVFQPHETTKKKSYCALGIIEVMGDFNDGYWSGFGFVGHIFDVLINIGCPIFKIRRISDIEHIIKDFE